ncbi:MAG: multidrug efflux SMR transporter [Bacteroidota bacterium]
MLNWVILIIAGIFEVCFTTCLSKVKTSTAQEAPWWWTGFTVSLFLSMYLLYKASQHIPMGTAYAVWTGIGAFGTVIIGILLFKEPSDAWRIFFLTLLIFSVAGLKMVTAK